MSAGCTCGPHPCVDLTDAYLQYYHKIHHQDTLSTSKQLTSCHEKIRQACKSHGCFHVSINLTNNSEDDYPIACLAKPIAQVEDEIESLFTPSFLKHTDANLNEGIYEVPMKQLSSSTTSSLMEIATFRGRTAESGDESQAKPESKLSWEFRRCRNARIQEGKNHISSLNKNEWSHLTNWTEALHSVASVVIHSLGISEQIVLNEKSCNCVDNCSNRDCNNLSQEHCNVDLLRCFRYDAVPFDEKDRLGSSSHTDWGALTAVFQDDKGGLQTYCHACDKWTDVAAPERKMSGNTANLFIHVGDFLSLTTHKDGEHPPIWPSPRHRVICPTKKVDESDESSQCRRSLVYFAYPPPNNSLAIAQEVVEPLISNDLHKSSIKFQDYSLLHDQSQQQQGAEQPIDRNRMSYEKYLDIRGKPFGKVIQEKWNQVQRS